MFMSAVISSSVRPAPSCSPTLRLRLNGLRHVVTRSPIPASPANVCASPPIATPSRRQLGQAARHHHRPRVVADAEALGDAAGDRHDVLQRAAELAADDVVVGVDAEQPARQHGLDRPGDGEVLGGDDAGRRLAGHDLAGDVRPGEGGDRVAGHLVADDLGHPQQRSLLEALGQADDRDPRVDPLLGRGHRRAHRRRRHADDQQLGVAHRLLQVVGGHQALRQREPGEVRLVGVVGVDLGRRLGAAGPDQRRVSRRHQPGDRRPPRPRPEHRDLHGPTVRATTPAAPDRSGPAAARGGPSRRRRRPLPRRRCGRRAPPRCGPAPGRGPPSSAPRTRRGGRCRARRA